MANLSKFVPFGRYDAARTHDESRAIVCCVCGRKVKKSKAHGSVHVVSEKFSNLVRKFVYGGYSVHNTAHPTGLCITCRLALSAVDKVP